MSDDPKHILCIDDEPDLIELFQIILRRKGYVVSGANGGEEGLNKIRETRPDLVLLDLMMSDLGGWEVYQQMKADEELKVIPVIIVTAKVQKIDQVLGLRIAQVDDYISKPFSPADLIKRVEKVLAKPKAT
jgi:two-component system, OmpR family, response regulator VicR